MSKIIGHCSICGKSVTKDDSYSNQHKNIICTSCVGSIAESLKMHEGLYVYLYIRDQGHSNDRQKLFHAMTAVFNKALYEKDTSLNPLNIGFRCRDYIKEAYNMTEDEAMLVVSQNIDKVDVRKIPLI